MASVALEPASGRSHAELAAIFNAGYEGYFTPFDVDEAAFRLMVETWDDDLDASRVVDGEPAGIAKLAIRGERGWIAGIGVAVAHRGTGAGEALMRGVIAEARSRGLREVWPEPVTAERAQGRIRADRTGREPWQRADESVANYTGVGGLESGRGAVLYRQSGERASLLQVSRPTRAPRAAYSSRSRRRRRR